MPLGLLYLLLTKIEEQRLCELQLGWPMYIVLFLVGGTGFWLVEHRFKNYIKKNNPDLVSHINEARKKREKIYDIIAASGDRHLLWRYRWYGVELFLVLLVGFVAIMGTLSYLTLSCPDYS